MKLLGALVVGGIVVALFTFAPQLLVWGIILFVVGFITLALLKVFLS